MKKPAFILLVLALATLTHAQSITQVYHYNNPVVTEHDGYQQIVFEGCLPYGQVGEPSLPWQNVSLILPQGEEASSINVEFSDWVELEGEYLLYPSQKPRPYSCEEVIPFAKDETLYRSRDSYPSKGFGSVSTQYLNGVAFAFSGFTPVQYVPAIGKVSYARTVTVSIATTASRDDHSRKLWLTPENEASVKRLAQNGNMLSSYRQRSREISGYDMLVITAEEWIPRFGEYINLYNEKGIRTHIVALEEIYATTSGRDEQEHIRNYIIQEYENNGISMVSLGGDVSIVPFRYLWCFAQEGYEDQLPSDMYYACLDGTLNDDNDDRWGEVGEDDLLPELGIGRLPFNNEAQFKIIMDKTFSYLLNPVLGEFTSPILGAEHLGDGYYGSSDMERLIGTSTDYGYTTKGYPTNYNFKKYYASHNTSFSGSGFRDVIITGGQYVHHVGHANTDYVAGWDGNLMNSNFFSGNDGVHHNYMLFHSHGCICGDFSHNCILEKLVTITTGFVVSTGNSRYGWYQPWGDGMAAHIHREMIDAYCNDRIPIIGMALREAKIATAPWVTINGEEGCMRWNLYCLNIMGDGALFPWFEEPFTPNVVYEQGIPSNASSTTVHVTHLEQPLKNYCVSLFDGETLLARTLTDDNGNAVLQFSPTLNVVGEMQLIVTGQSAWPQVLEMNGFESGTSYVYGDILSLEGEAINSTQLLYVSGDLYNKGDIAAQEVHAAITSDNEYITAHGSSLTIDEFAPNSTQHIDHLGLIDIADNIPDQTIFTLDLTTYVGDVSHTTQKSFIASAPALQFDDIVVDDSQGDHNGFIDPGERIILHISGTNTGHAIAPDVFLTVGCNDDRIYLEEASIPVGNVNAQSHFNVNLVFTSDINIEDGTAFSFDMELHTGAYTTPYQYKFTNGQVAESFESGDFSFMEWDHAGDLPWFITDDDAHTGSYSARTGAIGDNQFSRLLVHADVFTDSEISFWFKTSTEYHKDYFAFYIDDIKMDWWSGENDWTQISYTFDAGSHVFEWLYGKNRKDVAGMDCAWIDDIIMPRASLITDVEEMVSESTLLYPNPTKGTFILEVPEESNIEVFNLLGQCVINLGKVTGRQIIHLDSKGLYIIRIQNESGVETQKLIVE